jgi:hypothetical protein
VVGMLWVAKRFPILDGPATLGVTLNPAAVEPWIRAAAGCLVGESW